MPDNSYPPQTGQPPIPGMMEQQRSALLRQLGIDEQGNPLVGSTWRQGDAAGMVPQGRLIGTVLPDQQGTQATANEINRQAGRNDFHNALLRALRGPVQDPRNPQRFDLGQPLDPTQPTMPPPLNQTPSVPQY